MSSQYKKPKRCIIGLGCPEFKKLKGGTVRLRSSKRPRNSIQFTRSEIKALRRAFEDGEI